MSAGYHGNVDLSDQLINRGRVDKDRIKSNVEHRDDQRSGEQRARQTPMRFADFSADVGSRVPAGIRIHHKHQADRERGAHDLRQGGGAWSKRNRLRAAEHKTRDQKRDDEQQLENRPNVLKGTSFANAAQMYKRDKPG